MAIGVDSRSESQRPGEDDFEQSLSVSTHESAIKVADEAARTEIDSTSSLADEVSAIDDDVRLGTAAVTIDGRHFSVTDLPQHDGANGSIPLNCSSELQDERSVECQR